MKCTFVFEGDPVPLARPRFSGNHCWDSQKQAKLIIGLSMNKQFTYVNQFSGPVAVDFTFVFPTKKRIKQVEKDMLYDKPYTSRPDIDNCVKFYLDCANSILFEDDACIAQVSAKKIYGPKAQTIMIVSILDPLLQTTT